MKDNCPCIDCITLPICISEMNIDQSFALYHRLKHKCSLLCHYCHVSSLRELKKKQKKLRKVFKCDSLGLAVFTTKGEKSRSLLSNIKKKLKNTFFHPLLTYAQRMKKKKNK